MALLCRYAGLVGRFSWYSALTSCWVDGGGRGVSYVELLIFYDLLAEERPGLGKAVACHRRPRRPISVSAGPSGRGIDIWRSCRFIGCLMKAVCGLQQGIGRFIPCWIGANHCRLMRVGWGKVWAWAYVLALGDLFGPFLNELLVLFGYPALSCGASLGRALTLEVLRFKVCFIGFPALRLLPSCW